MEHFNFDGHGDDPAFSRKKLIDAGAYGEVHEVPLQQPLLTQ
jgi:hypothetical protein